MISVSWQLFLMVGLRYYWVCRLGKICNIFFYRLHRCEKCSGSTGLHSISCFSHLFQSARSGCTHENIFCVYAFLYCSSVLSPMPAIYSCRAIRLFLRLSDCLKSFTLLFLTLPLLLMVHASTLSAILHYAAAAGNLVCVKGQLCPWVVRFELSCQWCMTCCPSSISSITITSSSSFSPEDPPRSVVLPTDI